MKKLIAIVALVLITLNSYGTRIENEQVIYTTPPAITNAGGGGLNYIAGISNAVFTNGINITINNDTAIQFTNITGRIDYRINGRLFIANTNYGLYSYCSNNLSLYTSSNRLGVDVSFRTTNSQVYFFTQYATTTPSMVVGATNCFVGNGGGVTGDLNGYNINSLLWIYGSGDASGEFVRVNALAGTSVIFESPTLYAHGMSSVVSRVSEYSTRLQNKDGNNKLEGKLNFVTNSTINGITNIIEVMP